MRQPIEIVRGDTLAIVVKAAGQIVEVTSVDMTVRKKGDDSVLFALSTGTGGGITANSDGTWTIRIPPEATAAAPLEPYKYDIQFTVPYRYGSTLVGYDVYTPLYGAFILLEDQTREVYT